MLLTTCDNKTHTPHPRVASFLYSWIQGPTFPDVLTCPCFWLQCFANAERLTSHLASLFFNLPMLLTICDNKTHTTHPCVASFLYSRIQGPIFPDVLTVLLKDRLIFSMRFALPTDPRVASYLYPYKGSLKKKKKVWRDVGIKKLGIHKLAQILGLRRGSLILRTTKPALKVEP